MKTVNFTTPKIINDTKTAHKALADTNPDINETKQIENQTLKYKILFLQQTNDSSIILVNKHIYKQKKK